MRQTQLSLLMMSAALAIAGSANAGDVTPAGKFISTCGVLMEDYYYGCIVFVPYSTYDIYLLDDAGDFEVGEEVHLTGTATLDCASPCSFDACVFGGILGPCTPGIPGDLDGDGIVGAADLATMLAAWGECQTKLPCPADLTDDGTVGPADLAVLLANWTS